MTEQAERCDRGSGKEPPGWRQEVGTDPTEHHVVEIAQLLAPGHSDQIVRLVAICACGWRSGEHQVYLGASTGWAAERARRHLETAGIAHVRSLSPLPS